MGLEPLCAEIESRSHAQASAIIKAANEEAKRVLDAANATAQRTLEAARTEAEAFSSAESSSRLTSCQLEASRHLIESREEAVRQSLAQVWDYYRHSRSRAGYAARLKGWAQAALSELNAKGAVLRANESDLSILRDAGFKVSKKPLDCAGGVRAETPDGRIAVDYTLEAQFERKREELVHLLHLKLFADEGSTLLEIPAVSEETSKSSSKSARPRKTAKSSKAAKGPKASKPAPVRARPPRSSRVLDFSSMSVPVSSRSRLGSRSSKR